jgi:hypothetical protein
MILAAQTSTDAACHERGRGVLVENAVADHERLQTILDDIAGTVEWAAGWLEYLEENEVRGVGTSDLGILKADVARLRIVADALVPGRVRDTSSGRRWYLAPDETGPREQELQRALDQADREVERAAHEVGEQRQGEEQEQRKRKERQREDDERRQQHQEEQEQVAAFLRDHGPSLVKEIAEGTGLSAVAAERAVKAVAKRGKDQRFATT